jgi:cell shape-determining protein MreC
MEEQFKHGKERSKQQKLAQTEEKLKEILTFLQDYLPLVIDVLNPNEQFLNYIMASFYNSISENMKTEVLQYFEKPSYTWQLDNLHE